MTQTPDNLIQKHLDKVAISDGHVVELTKVVNAERLQLTLARQSSMITAINSLGSGVGALQIGSRESASKIEALLASFQGPIIRTVKQISNLSDNLVHGKTNQVKEERLHILQWLSSVQYKKHHENLFKVCSKVLDHGYWPSLNSLIGATPACRQYSGFTSYVGVLSRAWFDGR